MCLPQALYARPGHRPRTRRALDGGGAGLNVVGNVGAEAEGVAVARARCLAPWAGEVGAHVGWGMRTTVGHVCSRRKSALHRPAQPCTLRRSVQKGPIASTVCRARATQKVYSYITFYTS